MESPDKETWEVLKPYIDQISQACWEIHKMGWVANVEYHDSKEGLKIMVTVDKIKTKEKQGE